MEKDRIYATPAKLVAPFEFDEKVAQVFDDMLGRSVPLYRECLLRQAQLAGRFYQPGTRIYDLGCSHGNLGLLLLEELGDRLGEMVAADTSLAMLDRYRQRLVQHPLEGRVNLLAEDIRTLALAEPSVVAINLTLQFLPVANRDALITRVFDALRPGGILLLTEKTLHPNPELAALQQDFYYRFKAENGYSDLEISQKREALETVLIPESLECHLARLNRLGFGNPEVWLKWFNFASILCQKAG